MNSPAFYIKRFSFHSAIFLIAYLFSSISIIIYIKYIDLEMFNYIYKSLLHINMLIVSYFIISRPFIYPFRMNLSRLCAAERHNIFLNSILVVGSGLFLYKFDLSILLLLLGQCFVIYLFANCLEFLCTKLPTHNIRKIKRILHDNQQSMTDIIPGVFGENSNFAFLTSKNEYYICHTLYFSTVLQEINHLIYDELIKMNIEQDKKSMS